MSSRYAIAPFRGPIDMYFALFSGQATVRCYYCSVESNAVNSIFQHYTNNHASHTFSLRRKILNESNGNFMYRSIHFPVKVCDIMLKIKSGKQCFFDLDSGKLTFRNAPVCITNPEHSHELCSMYEADHSDDTYKEEDTTIPSGDICTKALQVVEETGRGKDFVHVLKSLADGSLDPRNICFHLLLDIGNLLSCESAKNMRYNTTTLDFWSLVYKMFRGKSTRFFRGTMSAACQIQMKCQHSTLPFRQRKRWRNM